MLKPKYLALCCLTILLLGLSSCSDDDKLSTAEFSSTTMPSEIPWTGGEYQFAVTPKAGGSVLPWSYRVVIDQEIVKIEENVSKEEITFLVDQNLTSNKRNVRVECNYDNSYWKIALNFNQNTGLVKVGPNYWATTNLTVKDGKFVFAELPTDYGLLFKHKSKYGVLIDGDNYSGTAYSPEPVTISIEDMESGNVDPCFLASNGKFRLPNLSELFDIFENLDESTVKKNDVVMWGVSNGKLMLPLAGVCEANGLISQQNMTTAYWGSTISEENKGAILLLNPEYQFIDFNQVGSLCSVRCVVNTEAPKYVSHSPVEVETNNSFEVEIVTSPGDLNEYNVALIADEVNIHIDAVATSKIPTVKLIVPKNESKDLVTYSIYINDEFSGQKIVQPGAKHFAKYVSHSPTARVVPSAEFELKVTVETDLDDVLVEIKTREDIVFQKSANSYQPKISFTIPENLEFKNIEYSIWVMGEDTGKKITQEAAEPKNLSVIWSDGYLTVKNGKYQFASLGERGLFFKFKSSLGMEVEEVTTSSGNKTFAYSGYVYAPERIEAEFVDVTSGDVDPCLLVEPELTWRMPTALEAENLLEFSIKDDKNNNYLTYSDGNQIVHFSPTGLLQHTTGKFQAETFIRLWTSTLFEGKDNSAVSISGTLRLGLSANLSAVFDQGLNVRCVQDR